MVVLTVLFVVFACLLMALLLCAGYVAVFVKDAAQRADAFKVLKLITYVVFGSGGTGGLIAVAIKLFGMSVL